MDCDELEIEEQLAQLLERFRRLEERVAHLESEVDGIQQDEYESDNPWTYS